MSYPDDPADLHPGYLKAHYERVLASADASTKMFNEHRNDWSTYQEAMWLMTYANAASNTALLAALGKRSDPEMFDENNYVYEEDWENSSERSCSSDDDEGCTEDILAALLASLDQVRAQGSVPPDGAVH